MSILQGSTYEISTEELDLDSHEYIASFDGINNLMTVKNQLFP